MNINSCFEDGKHFTDLHFGLFCMDKQKYVFLKEKYDFQFNTFHN